MKGNELLRYAYIGLSAVALVVGGIVSICGADKDAFTYAIGGVVLVGFWSYMGDVWKD